MRIHQTNIMTISPHATTTAEIYTLSLHDALPICIRRTRRRCLYLGTDDVVRDLCNGQRCDEVRDPGRGAGQRELHRHRRRSEEHTSELQSLAYLVCRLLPEKKKKRQ